MPGSVIFIIGPIRVNNMAGSASILIGDVQYSELTQQKSYRTATMNTGDGSPSTVPVTPMYNDPHLM